MSRRLKLRPWPRSGQRGQNKEFAGRSHFIIGQPGWEEVADFALAWAVRYSQPALFEPVSREIALSPVGNAPNRSLWTWAGR